MQRFDQAQRLREAVIKKQDINENYPADYSNQSNMKSKASTRVICISSGKGGVGKSNFTVNLALALQSQNKKVVIIDADLGLANVEILLNIMPKYSLLDIIEQNKHITQIIEKGPLDIGVISGGSGIQAMSELSLYNVNRLLHSIQNLSEIADYILIDTGAGISESVTSFIEASNELIVITTCEPPAIADAYALIKVIAGKDRSKKISLVVNRAQDLNESQSVYLKLRAVSKKFLNLDINYIGEIIEDDHVSKSVKQQVPFFLKYPKSKAAICIKNISYKIMEMPDQDRVFPAFINRLKGIFLGGKNR